MTRDFSLKNIYISNTYFITVMKPTLLILLTVFALTNVSGQTSQQETSDPEAYIRKESIGGKLDFYKLLENEKEGFLIQEGGVAYNKKDFAIYLWGKKVKQLGIRSSKKAAKLWEEIQKRELTDPEKKALIAGYDS
jgi:hypothetical protein